MTSLDKLINAYQEENLQPKNLQLVTDEEVQAFLNKRDWFWSILFWLIFTISILIPGVIGQ